MKTVGLSAAQFSPYGPQTKDFRFHILMGPEDKKPVLVISESLHRLTRVNGVQAIKLRGDALLRMLHADVGVLIALTDGVFGIPVELASWLRNSTQSAAP